MNEIITVIPEEIENESAVTDIVVVSGDDPLVEAAKRGLYGELSDLSIAMYQQAIGDFLSFMKENKVTFADSLPVAFSAYIKNMADRDYKPSTIKVKMVQIRRFFEWGARIGLIDHQTLLELRQVKSPKSLGGKYGRWIELKQMQAMLDAPDTNTIIGRRDKALLAILLGLGLRESEVVKLTWGHIERIGDSWVIVNLQRKHNRIQALIPVADWVMKAIEQYSPRGADNDHIIVSYDRHGNARKSISRDAIWRIVTGYAAKLGLGKFSPHDARRSFAREAKVNGGLELSQLALMLGHGSVAVTERYVNEFIDLEAISKAVSLEV